MEKYHSEMDEKSLYALQGRSPLLRKFFSELFMSVYIGQGAAVANLPPPNSIMRGYESTPGVWLFEDTCGYYWSVWSDGQYKRCYKGTSIFLLVPNNVELHDFTIIESFIRLYKFLDFELIEIQNEI